MTRRKRFRALLLAGLLLPAGSGADGSVPGWNRFVYLHYRLEVTGYCSLANEAVGRGFRIQRDAMLDEHDLTPELVDSARAEAWKLAYAEWDNRGLGGFRRWCQTDAKRYASGFIAVSEAGK